MAETAEPCLHGELDPVTRKCKKCGAQIYLPKKNGACTAQGDGGRQSGHGGVTVTHQFTQGGLIVPYITLWSGEREVRPRLEKRFGRQGAFLGYRDEFENDRDVGGALWARYSIAPGRGRADFRSVHALRQRNAMLRRLCQICRTSVLETGHEQELFLLKGKENRPITEGETTSAPPVCERCAPIAVRSCPHLKTAYTAAWVKHAGAWGVAGTAYDLDTLRPVPGMELVNVPYTSPLVRHVIAYRMVDSLHGCTPLGPNDLNAIRPPEPVAP